MPGSHSLNKLLDRSKLRVHDRYARARVEDLRENPYTGSGTGGSGDVAAHEAATDPHAQYLTQTEGDARYLQSVPSSYATDAEVTAAIEAHEAESDPHPTYLTQTEGDARYLQGVPSSYATDDEVAAAIDAHEAEANPHPGYLTQTEGDALYEPLGGGSGGAVRYATLAKYGL